MFILKPTYPIPTKPLLINYFDLKKGLTHLIRDLNEYLDVDMYRDFPKILNDDLYEIIISTNLMWNKPVKSQTMIWMRPIINTIVGAKRGNTSSDSFSLNNNPD